MGIENISLVLFADTPNKDAYIVRCIEHNVIHKIYFHHLVKFEPTQVWVICKIYFCILCMILYIVSLHSVFLQAGLYKTIEERLKTINPRKSHRLLLISIMESIL